MKNKFLLALFLVLPAIGQGKEGQSTAPFKLANLAREIKSQIFHQTPGVAISNLGLGVRFNNNIHKDLGINWGINADFLNEYTFISTDPSLSYDLNSNAYILAGINYASPNATWGSQYGAGFHFKRQLTFELLNRQINPQYAGLQLRATYYFN